MCPDGALLGPGRLISSTCWRTASREMAQRPRAALAADTLALVDQAEQDVLGADVVVVEHPGFFPEPGTTTPPRNGR